MAVESKGSSAVQAANGRFWPDQKSGWDAWATVVRALRVEENPLAGEGLIPGRNPDNISLEAQSPVPNPGKTAPAAEKKSEISPGKYQFGAKIHDIFGSLVTNLASMGIIEGPVSAVRSSGLAPTIFSSGHCRVVEKCVWGVSIGNKAYFPKSVRARLTITSIVCRYLISMSPHDVNDRISHGLGINATYICFTLWTFGVQGLLGLQGS
ncbi:hypothetical protein B0H13DRAFT_1866655 [Mycena leptocephala]|nr:hypothetical protein B0H13DRAFT_1866655 [Mycena leptocephala]